MKHFVLFALMLTPSAALADGFSPVVEKREFVKLVSGKALTRFGISLNVSPEGAIKGSAFGTPVTGSWRWQGGLFCRDMTYGNTEIAANCQLVERKGNTLRFTSDAGKGDSADLRLK
ncbi:dihydrodipicolinate reductase [Pseudorhodobacter sp. E13]|uniref:dihydrodipicolinate reductase n=1 Tax=Pseudorhodobacter sp. E13 TaxID=2487931 RepID=UPI000F8CF6E3|nr:dihydrodipicolinate reductase [Pseudorhodobacter sp. E13]RUS64944.1 dihydrodipicolinate reductase [Pseudorhodobacter sp. E13]